MFLQPQKYLKRGAMIYIVPFRVLNTAFKFLNESFSKCHLGPLNLKDKSIPI